LCSNTCSYSSCGYFSAYGYYYSQANNKICDDGGPGSQFSCCARGTDCKDCGGVGVCGHGRHKYRCKDCKGCRQGNGWPMIATHRINRDAKPLVWLHTQKK
jgi:hypothetical protein